MRVVLIAPTCDGHDIGEAWVAFQWARLLSQEHDLTLLTYHKRGKLPATSQLPGTHVVEWAEPPFLGHAERLNSMLKPGYAAFHFRARRWLRDSLARGEHYDLVHQVTPVAMRYPSPATGLDIPTIIGPVGGGLSSPPGFSAEEGTNPWYVKLRQLDHTRLQRDPWLRRTYADASCVLGIAPYVRDLLNGVHLKRFETMSETGLVALPPLVDRGLHTPPIRLLYVGRIVRTKGLRDLIRALGQVRDLPVRLDVVGAGPDRPACEDEARRSGLADLVAFHGMVDHDRVDHFYREADIFTFPSYREPGGNVIHEALGHGLPLIVCNRGGPGATTDDTCAIRLPVTTPTELTHGIADAIRALVSNPKRRIAMGHAAREFAARHSLWSTKIAAAGALYQSVAN